MERQFTSAEVVELTGITPRQLQWWDERGIVRPGREGRKRMYSEQDIAEVAVICALRRKGFPLQRVRRIIRWLQKEFGGRLADAVSSGSDYHLLTDGKRIYLENSQRQVIDILKNSRQPLLGICLSDAVRELRGEIFSRRPAQATRGPRHAGFSRGGVEVTRGSRHAGFSRDGVEKLRRGGKRRSS